MGVRRKHYFSRRHELVHSVRSPGGVPQAGSSPAGATRWTIWKPRDIGRWRSRSGHPGTAHRSRGPAGRTACQASRHEYRLCTLSERRRGNAPTGSWRPGPRAVRVSETPAPCGSRTVTDRFDSSGRSGTGRARNRTPAPGMRLRAHDADLPHALHGSGKTPGSHPCARARARARHEDDRLAVVY